MIFLLLVAAQAPPKLGCDAAKADQGKCKSAETCKCDPVRGERTQGRTLQEDGRTKTLVYFDPQAYAYDAEEPNKRARDKVANPITVQVAEEFWTRPKSRKFYENGHVTLERIKKACAEEMHQVFDVREESSRSEVILGMETKVVHFRILYGYSYYIRGPGTTLHYVTVYSNLPRRFCRQQAGVSYPNPDNNPHKGENVCGGHEEPWEHNAKFAMAEYIRKEREAETCTACSTPYEGRMKSTYYAQWDLAVNGAGAAPPGEPAGPSSDLTVNWSEIADLIKDAAPKALAKTPPGAIIQELASNADLFSLTPRAGGGAPSPDQDALTIVAECATRMELDPSGKPDLAVTTMRATEQRTVTAAASAAHPSDGSSREHWRQNALRSGASVLEAGRLALPLGTRDKSGRNLHGEMLTWETRVHNGPFQKAALIVDAVGTAVSIRNSGRSWGKGTFTLTSVPCVEAVHPCECLHAEPHTYKFEKETPPLTPPHKLALEELALLLDAPPVVVPAAGAVELTMNEGVALPHGSAREWTVLGGSSVIPISIIPGDPGKPRLRLIGGGGRIDFDRPGHRTGLVVLEDVDRPDPGYRLRDGGGDLTGYRIDVTIHDGDRAYHVGRFDRPDRSTTGDPLEVVDENGTTTPLTGLTLGSAMPSIRLPATVPAGRPATASVTSDFGEAARASGLPASLLRTKIWQRAAGGDTLLKTTTSAVETLSVSPAPGEREIRLVARYVPEAGALEEALSALRDSAARAKGALPPEVHDAVDAAVRAREAAIRERLKN